MKDCIFCKIRDKEIPKEFEYVDEEVMVFEDINKIKPVHLLIVPKKHIKDFYNFNDERLELKINEVIKNMIKRKELYRKGYKIFLNGGGAQLVDHLHIHLTGPWGKEA